jgi:import inner membrane translocase subunit TIM44
LFAASIFSQSETSEALTEICRVDPAFDVARFLRIVQYDIIPNIFEVKKKKHFSEI